MDMYDLLGLDFLSGFGSVMNLLGEFTKPIPTPGKVIFVGNQTIVTWSDGETTTVKCMEGDTFSEEMGLAMSYVRKFGTNTGFKRLIANSFTQEID